jgi:hypothetical protein
MISAPFFIVPYPVVFFSAYLFRGEADIQLIVHGDVIHIVSELVPKALVPPHRHIRTAGYDGREFEYLPAALGISFFFPKDIFVIPRTVCAFSLHIFVHDPKPAFVRNACFEAG